MGGLTGALNIAKNSLLAFQLATQVIGHNISNVNNENYSRQKIIEGTYPPSPSPVGPIGTGVRVEYIQRFFDVFLERNLNLKYTDFGLFKAEEEGLTILESLFNEVAQGVGFTETLKNFWKAWQTLATNPENLAARTQVLEYGKLIVELFKSKFQALKDLEAQIGLKLKTLVERINTIASQISQLNLQITAIESGNKKANDLRDQRDALIRELSQLVSIQYFETKEGAYNVILGKGYNIVNIDKVWKLEISGTDLYWIDTQGNKVPLTSKEVGSGELGGWLRLLEQLSDKFNYEYVSGNKMTYDLTGKLVTEITKLTDLGLSGFVSFQVTGTDHFGNDIDKTISFDLTTNPNVTIRDLLYEIEKAFDFTIEAYIKDGRLFIQDRFRGPGKLSFSLTFNGDPFFGSFNDPAYQRRVSELNLAGRLKLFGEELVKAVNQLHTQGVGLTFYTGELEGAYFVNQYIKELPYFLNLAKTSTGDELTGFFYLWIKDPQEKIIPVRVSLQGLSVEATLDDLANRINETLSEVGLQDHLEAFVRNGKLILRANEGYSFSFSNDTSGILLSTGLNLFFVGTDPENLSISPNLIYKPELLSSGKMDITSFRTENPLFGKFRSESSNIANFTFDGTLTKVYVKLYDDKVNAVSLFKEKPEIERIFFILGRNIGEDTKLTELGFSLGEIISFNGTTPTGDSIFDSLIVGAFTTVKDLMEAIRKAYAGSVEVYIKEGMLVIESNIAGTSSLEFFSSELSQNLVFGPNYKWSFISPKVYYIEIPVVGGQNGETLSQILAKLDRLPYVRAYIDEQGHAVITLELNQTTVYALELGDNSVTNGLVDFLKLQKMYIPAFRGDPRSGSITKVITGLEVFPLDQVYADHLSFYLFDQTGKHIDTFRINLEAIVDPISDKNMFDIIREINAPQNMIYGLSARLDREGRLIIETTGLYKTKTFIVQDEVWDGQNFIQTSYDKGFINFLKGYQLKRGDNRAAQAIADLSSAVRETLNYSTLENYYSSMVGEVGAVAKAVRENKNFLEALISQLKAIRDSVSGVSLDEEMTNLIKYQQAFAASAKLLSAVEEMFETLIAAKR